MNWLIRATDTVRELWILYAGVVCVAATGYSLFEHKSLAESLWWTVVTAMTVGYGDDYPVTVGGRVIAILLMHIVILFIVPMMTARIASTLIVNNDAFSHDEQEQIKSELAEIKRLVTER